MISGRCRNRLKQTVFHDSHEMMDAAHVHVPPKLLGGMMGLPSEVMMGITMVFPPASVKETPVAMLLGDGI